MKASTKKKINRTLLVILVLGLIYRLILFPTGVLRFYTIPSTANTPSISMGDRIVTTNLSDSEVLDFVIFRHKDTVDIVFRLIGNEGDTIQIKNGVAFNNGQNIDASLDLMKNYKANKEQFSWLRTQGKVDENYMWGYGYEDFMIGLKDSDTLIKHWNLERHGLDNTEPEENIQKVYQENWNYNNFGPLIIPKNKFFVLGDYRDNSMDSRYLGLIDKGDYKGKVIFIF